MYLSRSPISSDSQVSVRSSEFFLLVLRFTNENGNDCTIPSGHVSIYRDEVILPGLGFLLDGSGPGRGTWVD